MTENDLFKAVHAYAAHLDDHGPDLTEREARDALLEAIKAYAVAKELLTAEDPTRDDVIAWARCVSWRDWISEAKALGYDPSIAGSKQTEQCVRGVQDEAATASSSVEQCRAYLFVASGASVQARMKREGNR